MPSPYLRLGSLTFSWAIGFLAVSPLLAQEGDDCRSDSDCEAGYECDLPPRVPGAEPPTGQCEWRGQPCEIDEDCPANYSCEADEVDVACASGQECPEPQRRGYCEPGPIACDADRDCPEASYCNDEGACAYALIPCEEDSECGSRYSCYVIARTGSCEVAPCATDPAPAPNDPVPTPGAGGAAAGSEADAGAADSADDSSGGVPNEGGDDDGCTTEPVCVETEVRACFPRAVECQTDDDCEGGWLCTDIPDDDGPGDWARLERGCLPEGIALAVAGVVAVEGAVGSSDPDSGRATSSSDGLQGEEDDGTESGKGASDDTSNSGQVSEKEMSSAGGCAVSRPTRRSTGLPLLAGLALLIGLRRRRMLS